jgi:hypothetical protein
MQFAIHTRSQHVPPKLSKKKFQASHITENVLFFFLVLMSLCVSSEVSPSVGPAVCSVVNQASVSIHDVQPFVYSQGCEDQVAQQPTHI